ncbi:hypothetical protein M406DRAFT_70566 [Cryphonectria parasitica EP155]|uniref:Uncharacterized protein n=1 Tax=Cryphonectria parasitica (strain ATCC 38755 / EP155) TaxID=660469 RepID=A0A9P4Y226_CRYP1|nr:uncharacterized protein M406DRAFT_70566 [Cryphonectria parasitica EP155]KAF3764922.1 hypothetical protein M406DRAFT_70566 [Cryphonectria parasitica EP155]
MGLSCFCRCVTLRHKAKVNTNRISSSSSSSSSSSQQVKNHGSTSPLGWTAEEPQAEEGRPKTPLADPARASADAFPMVLPAVCFQAPVQPDKHTSGPASAPVSAPVSAAWPTTPPCAACQRAMEKCPGCFRRSQDAGPRSPCDGCRLGLCRPHRVVVGGDQRGESSNSGLWSDEETLSRLEGRGGRVRRHDEEQDNESYDADSEFGVWFLSKIFEVDNVVVATGVANLVDVSQ